MNFLASPSGFLALILFTGPLAPEVIGQIPAGSSARRIQNDVQNSDSHISQLIAKAEDHFRKGKLNLEDNKRDLAREEFDRAIDAILESGMDVRASQRLQLFYLELVERIYREEVPRPPVRAVTSQLQTNKPAQIGFLEKKFEPSPLDELGKMVLDPDERSPSRKRTTDLRAEFIAATKDYQASLKKLLATYERDLLRAQDQLTQAKALYSRGLIGPSPIDQCERRVAAAKKTKSMKPDGCSPMLTSKLRRHYEKLR